MPKIQTTLPGCSLRTQTQIYNRMGWNATLSFQLECMGCSLLNNDYEVPAELYDCLTLDEFIQGIGKALYREGYRYGFLEDSEGWVCPDCVDDADVILEVDMIRDYTSKTGRIYAWESAESFAVRYNSTAQIVRISKVRWQSPDDCTLSPEAAALLAWERFREELESAEDLWIAAHFPGAV